MAEKRSTGAPPREELGVSAAAAQRRRSGPRRGRELDVFALAATQHGVVTTKQLLARGLSHQAICHRVATGRFARLHRGVYLVGPVRTALTDAMAAVLAYGDGAVVSHESAARILGLRAPDPAAPVDVTTPRRPRSRSGIRLHYRSLEPRDVIRHDGVPVTMPARTLLDLAETLPAADLERAIEEAQVRHGTRQAALDEVVRRHANRRGAPALRAAIQHEPGYTRSQAERVMRALVRAARLPPPAYNAALHGYTVDVLWRDARLVVEIDGYRFHRTRGAFERDRSRDADLQARGHRVLRFTWRQLVDEPHAVAARVAATLARAL